MSVDVDVVGKSESESTVTGCERAGAGAGAGVVAGMDRGKARGRATAKGGRQGRSEAD